MQGIAQCRVGNRVGDISHAVQTHAEAHGYSVVQSMVGHGVGRDMHEDPQVPNFGPARQGPELREGMVLAIEPMVNAGGYRGRDGRGRLGHLHEGWKSIGPFRTHGRHHQQRPSHPY